MATRFTTFDSEIDFVEGLYASVIVRNEKATVHMPLLSPSMSQEDAEKTVSTYIDYHLKRLAQDPAKVVEFVYPN